ncbi:hypothetical protein ACL9RL_09405 [Plantibacter sp. Mn2098]|uniref:hypothetical protein n=1 Tax=Plantibacter sp. Mn2098 TaxID=3395266 RepID=UPI003BCDC3C8
MRTVIRIERIPSRKQFIVYVLQGASAADRRTAEKLAPMLARGWWAYVPDGWFRWRNPDGAYRYWQLRGELLDDPLMQLELEMMIDATTSTGVSL